ncbi:hypothetical protein EIN_225560 [Entamoeba invadens IP1]|uniref:Uncharacterized protein n=1 Tax=Entamoeba invadens IP1 TaxID=370355 RepID=A0A0A1U8C5_ENTIV|nr:hypothetical protein EIN_225560 [Entamoeba invadens IP1]ELP88233.1 hypothetical protein EIN_225560 [Entamoeba invadens IP1]|eukprot:XP_004255004.1 hypothetical protein EIN_225560 [Entamoeba invadens IP1]
MLLALFLSLVLSLTVEPIDFLKGDATKNHVVISAVHSNVPNYVGNVYAYREKSSDTVMNIVVEMNGQSKVTKYESSQLTRPQIGFAKNNMYIMNHGNIDVYNLNSSVLTSKPAILSGVESFSPLTVITKEFVTGKQEVFLVVCRNGGLAVYNETFAVVQQTTNPCGNYTSFGSNYLMVKSDVDIELYTFNSPGVLTFYDNIEFADATSQTVATDPAVINEFDVIYTLISDKNKVQVNSPNAYKSPVFITNVFINPYGSAAINTFIDTNSTSLLATYNSFLLIGAVGYAAGIKERTGGAYLFFDKYLVTQRERFERVWSVNGSLSYDYMGYVVAMDQNNVYLGGKVKLETNGSLTGVKIDVSKFTKNYCTGVICSCPQGYYYNSYFRQCFKQVGGVSSIIIAIVCVFVLILLVGFISVMYNKWSKKGKKMIVVDGTSYAFTQLNEIQITLSSEVLTFGYENGKLAPINTSLQQSVTITNNSMTTKKFSLELKPSYKFTINANTTNFVIKSQDNATVIFTITMNCTCKTDDDDWIGFRVTEEKDESSPQFINATIDITTEDSVFIDYKTVAFNRAIANGPNSETVLVNYKEKPFAMKKNLRTRSFCRYLLRHLHRTTTRF